MEIGNNCKGTNLARKGKYSGTLRGRLRARAISNHYSLVRPKKKPSDNNNKDALFVTML